MHRKILYPLLTSYILILIFSCQRELSFENGQQAMGSLKSDITGDCLPKNIAGIYIVGKSLGDTNYIEVDVNVTQTGNYTILTDTVNGYSFKGRGNFTSTGSNHARLTGNGKPIAVGTNNFTVRFDSSNCQIKVDVLTRSGNIGPASYTFQGAPDTCMNAVLFGSYIKNIALDTSDHINVLLKVTTPGTYSILTNTTNGYSFSGSGTLAATGTQIVSLKALGKPISAGKDIFTVTAGNSSCTFAVTVLTAVPVTNNDHFPLTKNSYWTYDDLYNAGDTLKRAIIDSVYTNGNLYKVMEENLKIGAPFQFLYRKIDSIYYDYGSVDRYTTAMQFLPPIQKEIPFLKEGLTAGTVWTSDEYSGPASFGQTIYIRYLFTCSDANAAVTINGKTYINVYKIIMKPQIRSAITYPYNDTGERRDIFYAKGVGIIYTKFTVQNFIQMERQIRNYKVY